MGVAISDPDGRVATPLTVIDVSTDREGRQLARIVEDYEIGRIVVGLPLSLDGTEGPQARRVRAQTHRLAQFLPVEVEFADERLSSVEAKRRMSEAGADERTQRGSVDMIAASIFLQGYLDARVAHDNRGDEEE